MLPGRSIQRPKAGKNEETCKFPWARRKLKNADDNAGGVSVMATTRKAKPQKAKNKAADTTNNGLDVSPADPDGLIQRVVGLRELRQKVLANPTASEKRDSHVEALAQLEQRTIERFLSRHESASGRAQVTVAVVGDFSSGKSTFINALLGQDLCPVDVAPTTSSITYF